MMVFVVILEYNKHYDQEVLYSTEHYTSKDCIRTIFEMIHLDIQKMFSKRKRFRQA